MTEIKMKISSKDIAIYNIMNGIYTDALYRISIKSKKHIYTIEFAREGDVISVEGFLRNIYRRCIFWESVPISNEGIRKFKKIISELPLEDVVIDFYYDDEKISDYDSILIFSNGKLELKKVRDVISFGTSLPFFKVITEYSYDGDNIEWDDCFTEEEEKESERVTLEFEERIKNNLQM